jgi:hypothetical protein
MGGAGRDDGRVAATLRVRVRPRAGRDEIVGWQGQTLTLRVAAPPVAGRANQAVTHLIARAVGVPPTAVSLVGGARGRDKLVRVVGLDPAVLRQRLPP